MKEKTIKLYKILHQFYNEILKRTILFFILGSLIIFVVQTWRYNIPIYIFYFIICFSINFFLVFRKREINKELEKGDV